MIKYILYTKHIYYFLIRRIKKKICSIFVYLFLIRDWEDEFLIYNASSAGGVKQLFEVKSKAINSTPYLLNKLVDSQELLIESTSIFSNSKLIQEAQRLKKVFNLNGTDKPEPLYMLYSYILGGGAKVNSK